MILLALSFTQTVNGRLGCGVKGDDMARIELHISDRDRVCKLCGLYIPRFQQAYVFRAVHVPPKKVDLHMHLACLSAEIEMAMANGPTKP